MYAKSHVIIFIVFALVLAQMGADIYLPTFPAIAQYLNTEVANVQFSYSVYFFSLAIATLFYGPLADRCGRKPVLLMGIGLFTLLSLVAPFVTSIEQLIIIRVLQGVSVASCSVVPRAMMRDHFSGEALRTINLLHIITWAMVPLFMPLLGSYIVYYLGWQFNFYFLELVGAIVLMMAMSVKETLQEKDCRLAIKEAFIIYRQIITHRNYYPPLICVTLIMAVSISYSIVAPVIIQTTLGLSALVYGWSVFVIALTLAIGPLLNNILLKFFKSEQVIHIAIVLIFFGILLLFSSVMFGSLTLWQFVVPICILEVGSSIWYPILSTKLLQQFPEHAGKASSVFTAVAYFGSALLSCFVSMLPHHNLLALSLVFFAVLFVLVAIHVMERKRAGGDPGDH